MVAVIDRAPEKGGEYTALLALANRADDAGRNVWYDPERIAFESRQTTKNLEIVLGKLLAKGRISIDPGMGPQGKDLIHIHLPQHKLTRDHWNQMTEARVAGKRAAGKTTLGRPRKPKNGLSAGNEKFSTPEITEPGAGNENFSPASSVDSGTKTEKFSPNREKFSTKMTPPYRLAGRFPTPYSPVQSFLSVIKLASDPRVTCAARATDLATPLIENESDDWGDEDHKLFSPDGEAPTGAASHEVTPSLDQPEGVQEAETATDLPKVPPAPARVPAEPGSPEHERLTALCGGGVRNPNLPKLLIEPTRGGGKRAAWLLLSLADIERAHEYAQQARVAGQVYRTALLDALDAAVDGTTLPEHPTAERVTAPRIPVEQQARPGDGGTTTRPNPWQMHDRVTVRGQLGVVVGSVADARQALVTVDLDNGKRVVLTSTQFDLLVASDEPMPKNEHPLIGTTWQLRSGQLVTVTGVRAGRPITSDGTTWPPFGASSLERMAQRVEGGSAAHGAA